MTKNNNQILSALLDKVDTAWTYIIVCIAVAMIVVIGSLRAIGIVKEEQQEGQKDLRGDNDPLQ